MPAAVIFGTSGPRLRADEAAFFRDVDPWGFILFARNVEDPEQLRRLTGDLRDAVGRDAPILVDQEGGRVQRLRAPHWREWQDMADLIDSFTTNGADEELVLEALRLRYRIIAGELRAVGIDVNCAPLLDIPVPGCHDIIAKRALGRDPDRVAARGRAVCEGLLAGGVLPVVKHMPGQGRGEVDSHHSVPRTDASHEELSRIDFAPFRGLSDQVLGMTGHIVLEAIDPDSPATHSAKVIGVIRREIGFDGLLMTDDLSMQALTGSVEQRAGAALAAGCDLALHCNGDMGEMQAIARILPRLAGQAADRAGRAEQARPASDGADIAEAFERYSELVGEVTIG